jgi:hypothetical protein
MHLRRIDRFLALPGIVICGLLGTVAPGRVLAQNRNLTVTVIGSGSVSSSPSGINGCASSGGNNCKNGFSSGTVVTLTATANSGSSLTGWTVSVPANAGPDCSGTTGTCTVTMNTATDVTTTFVAHTPTHTPSQTSTSTHTSTQTPTHTPTHSATVTPTPTSSPTQTSTLTDSPTVTQTPTNPATETPTSPPSLTPTNSPTVTQTPTHTPTSIDTPTVTPIPTSPPTDTPTETPPALTQTSTAAPTDTPSVPATNTPPAEPTNTPTGTPTHTLMDTPTVTPTATVAVTFSYTIGSPNTLIVSVTASLSCGPTCPAFDYDWDWGDGTAHGAGQTESHTYDSPGTKFITLAVSLSGEMLGSVTRSLTLPNPDFPPAAGAACTWNGNTWTMTVLDTSSDDGPDADTLPGDGNASLRVVIDWGDGSTKSFGKQGASFSHTYIRTGAFTVADRVIDSKLQQDSTTCPVPATVAFFTISGTVKSASGASLNLATVTVRSATTGLIAKTVNTGTNGFFSVGSLKPDTYWVVVTKNGYTFPAPTTAGNPALTVGPDQLNRVITAQP